MLKKVLLGPAAVLAVFLVVVAFQPSEYRVSRSATFAAARAAVFPLVNEPRKWEPWNPWGMLDPAMRLTYAGPASGVGASYAWVGNSEVGEGRMTITESRPNEMVLFNLKFFKPMRWPRCRPGGSFSYGEYGSASWRTGEAVPGQARWFSLESASALSSRSATPSSLAP
jgi:hypothetical protein